MPLCVNQDLGLLVSQRGRATITVSAAAAQRGASRSPATGAAFAFTPPRCRIIRGAMADPLKRRGVTLMADAFLCAASILLPAAAIYVVVRYVLPLWWLALVLPVVSFGLVGAYRWLAEHGRNGQ